MENKSKDYITLKKSENKKKTIGVQWFSLIFFSCIHVTKWSIMQKLTICSSPVPSVIWQTICKSCVWKIKSSSFDTSNFVLLRKYLKFKIKLGTNSSFCHVREERGFNRFSENKIHNPLILRNILSTQLSSVTKLWEL